MKANESIFAFICFYLFALIREDFARWLNPRAWRRQGEFEGGQGASRRL
jgi:hypothetical protein